MHSLASSFKWDHEISYSQRVKRNIKCTGFKCENIAVHTGCTGVCVEGKKEENVLFNDALSTFYLRLYGVGNVDVYSLLLEVCELGLKMIVLDSSSSAKVETKYRDKRKSCIGRGIYDYNKKKPITYVHTYDSFSKSTK